MDTAAIVLLAEDNEDDVFLFRRALKQAGVDCLWNVAEDGQKVIDYLSRKGVFSNPELSPFPGTIFLDLKMPYKTGLEVLEWFAKQPFNPRPKVVVLTSSAEERDVRETRRLGAMAYLLKPPRPETLKLLISSQDKEMFPPIPDDLFQALGGEPK